jgi:hypothetical protein
MLEDAQSSKSSCLVDLATNSHCSLEKIQRAMGVSNIRVNISDTFFLEPKGFGLADGWPEASEREVV